MTVAGVAANLGGVALFALPGLGVGRLLGALRGLRWPQRLAYGFLLGVAAVAGGLFAASHCAGVPLRRPAIVAAVLLPSAAGCAAWLLGRRSWRRRRGQAGEERAEREGRARLAATLTLAAAAAAVVLGPLVSALISPLADWDGRMTWVPLGAHMRYEGTVDAEVLRDARWYAMHPRYPPLLPVAQAVVQEAFAAGDDDQYYRGIYVAFLAALLLVVHDGVRRTAGRLPAALTALAVATLPFLSYGAGGATSAYSDLPLAAFYGGAVVLLLTRRATPAGGLAAGILLAAALLTKNEGELLAAAALALGATRLWVRRPAPQAGDAAAVERGAAATLGDAAVRGAAAVRRRVLLWFGAAALPALAAVLLLASWRAAIPNRDDEGYFAALRLTDLLHGALARLPWIAAHALRLTFDGSWLGFWLAFAAVLAAGHRALRQPAIWRLTLAGLAPLGIAWAAYAVSRRLPDLLPETWPRFLLHGLVPLAVVFGCALGGVLRQLPESSGPRSESTPNQPA